MSPPTGATDNGASDALAVVHVVAADLSAGAAAEIRALRAYARPKRPHFVLQVGAGPVDAGWGHDRVFRRVDAPLGAAWLASRRLGRAIDEFLWPRGLDACLLLAWGGAALKWCMPLARAARPILASFDFDQPPREIVARLAARPAGASAAIRTTSAHGAQVLERAGAADAGIALFPVAPLGALRPHLSRAQTRAALGVSAEERLLAAIPPVQARSGAVLAAWAALIVNELRHDVRIATIDAPAGATRLGRFVPPCRHGLLTPAQPVGVTLDDLLAASDVALYLAPRPAALWGLARAAGSGTPILALDRPGVREILAQCPAARLIDASAPREIARAVLELVEAGRLASAAAPADDTLRLASEFARACAALRAPRGGLLANKL